MSSSSCHSGQRQVKLIWPLDDHYITRDFYYKASIYIGGQHSALDLVRLQGDTAGRGIRAVADGIVEGDAWDQYSGYYIVLAHAGGWRTMYRHLVTDAPPVIGQHISQGEVIGNVGSTGMSTGPHLHFDLWHRQKHDDTAFSKSGWWAHDPELYLGKEEEDMLTPEDTTFIEAQTAHLEKRQNDWGEVMQQEHEALEAKIATLQTMVDALILGGGLTEEEAKEAAKQAAREGTG